MPHPHILKPSAIFIGLGVFIIVLIASQIDADPFKHTYNWNKKQKTHQTIVSRFPAPKGFTRTEEPKTSFASWLRGLPLLPKNSPVLLYDGTPKFNQKVHAAVVDMDVGNRDRQQCADAVIRLRSEYLYSIGKAHQICFRFTNGIKVPWKKWANGFRPKLNGNKMTWAKDAPPGGGYKTFRQYLNRLFQYAGTASLSKELRPLNKNELIAPGDVFIQGGFPGHAVIVVDTVSDANGNRRFMLAQSYMPAQQLHILVNPTEPSISPWYDYIPGKSLQTPEWHFKGNDLKRFPSQACQSHF